jgi:uncharacterized protein (TIGR00251 family)
MPAFLQPHAGGFYLAVKLQPRASRDEIGKAVGSELRIKVTAPPADSAANEALVRLLADTLGCPRNAVQLVRGHTSRHKLISIQGLSAEIIAAKLNAEPLR